MFKKIKSKIIGESKTNDSTVLNLIDCLESKFPKIEQSIGIKLAETINGTNLNEISNEIDKNFNLEKIQIKLNDIRDDLLAEIKNKMESQVDEINSFSRLLKSKEMLLSQFETVKTGYVYFKKKDFLDLDIIIKRYRFDIKFNIHKLPKYKEIFSKTTRIELGNLKNMTIVPLNKDVFKKWFIRLPFNRILIRVVDQKEANHNSIFKLLIVNENASILYSSNIVYSQSFDFNETFEASSSHIVHLKGKSDVSIYNFNLDLVHTLSINVSDFIIKSVHVNNNEFVFSAFAEKKSKKTCQQLVFYDNKKFRLNYFKLDAFENESVKLIHFDKENVYFKIADVNGTYVCFAKRTSLNVRSNERVELELNEPCRTDYLQFDGNSYLYHTHWFEKWLKVYDSNLNYLYSLDRMDNIVLFNQPCSTFLLDYDYVNNLKEKILMIKEF